MRTRKEIEDEISAAEGEIACVIAELAIEVILDMRDLLEEIRDNTGQS